MHNRELKQDLITREVYQQYCDAHNQFFTSGLNAEDRALYVFLTDEEYQACEQLRWCKQKQRKKIMEWLDYWLKVPDIVLMFGTQTFNDETLQKTESARAKAVQRMLTQFEDYASNIDYGKESGREHYHFIIVADKQIADSVEWKKNKRGRKYASTIPGAEKYLALGNQNFQLIDTSQPKFAEKLAGYIAKLVNHSLKVKQSRLGYKRDSAYQGYQKAKNYLKTPYLSVEKRLNAYERLDAWITDRKMMRLFDGLVDFVQ